jgi:hypothetical protein
VFLQRLHSALRLGSLREQLEELRRLQDAFEKTGIVKKEKVQRLSSALSQVEADNRAMTARYQQLELRPSPPASTNALPRVCVAVGNV